MKQFFAVALFTALVLSGSRAADGAPPAAMLSAGVMAPDFSSIDVAGREVRLADYRGKILVLDFWATWCAPCIASMPHTNEVAAKYADQGVVVLAVCTGDKRQKFADWVKLKAGAYPAVRFTFDPHEQGTPAENRRASLALYGVPAIPAQFIVDREGRIVATAGGYTPGDTRLEAGLAKAGVRVSDAAIAQAAKTQQRIDDARKAAAVANHGQKVAPPAFTEDAVRLKAGAAMPELALRDADGRELNTSSLRGHATLLCFSPAEMIPADYLDGVVAKYGAQGVRVLVVVTRDTPENYRSWLALHGAKVKFTTALDPAGAEAIRESAVFQAIGMVAPMPFALVLDAQGRLVGKIAPKVATSLRGLAELLRRAGVKVAPEDLPTPDMFPKPAVAAAPAPAAGNSVAPATAPSVSAESAADRDYAAFVALRKESPPGKPLEMGGMKKYVEWVDARAQKLTADGLAFYQNYPKDPRRWDVVLTMINRAPYFMKDFTPKPGVSATVNDIVPDEAAKQAWTARTEELKRALLAASDSQPEQREMIEFQEFAATSRGLRAKLKSGEEKDARALWLGLLARFDAHIARYAGNSRLGSEAENFLSAWREVVPGSLEEGCRHFLAAPDAGVKKFAAEKLAALAQIEKPLELAFTAVDGRPVDLAKLRGKVVLVDFWATWCGPCKAELPNVIAAYHKYHAQGFEVVGITLENGNLAANDTPAQREAKLAKARKILTDFTAEQHMPWPQHFDGLFWKNEFATKFGIGAIPAMFLVDQAGRIVTTNARGEKLEQEIKRLLNL